MHPLRMFIKKVSQEMNCPKKKKNPKRFFFFWGSLIIGLKVKPLKELNFEILLIERI